MRVPVLIIQQSVCRKSIFVRPRDLFTNIIIKFYHIKHIYIHNFRNPHIFGNFFLIGKGKTKIENRKFDFRNICPFDYHFRFV